MIYMDPLEKFVQHKRVLFDSERPGLTVWANIEKGLKARVGIRKRPILKLAAAIALLLTFGGIVGFFLSLRFGTAPITGNSDIPEDLIQAVEYYRDEIDEMMVEASTEIMEEEIKYELEQLDLIINQLKEELRLAPTNSKETVFNAIVQAYESKLELLERLVDDKNRYKVPDNEVEFLKL